MSEFCDGVLPDILMWVFIPKLLKSGECDSTNFWLLVELILIIVVKCGLTGGVPKIYDQYSN